MTATQTEPSQAPSYETVWAMMQELAASQKETDRIIKENAKKAEQRWFEDQQRWLEEAQRRKEEEQRRREDEQRRLEEAQRRKEEDAQRREEEVLQQSIKAQRRNEEEEQWRKNYERRWRKIEKNLGGLGNSMGELIETLFAARLWEKFAAYPYNLRRAYQRVNIYDETGWEVTDVDILLADTEWVMAVEVKRESTDIKDVDRHIKRMSLIRQYPPAETVGKKLLGAFACGIVSPEVRDYAYASGFFVLRLKGESVHLIPPPEGFSPAIW